MIRRVPLERSMIPLSIAHSFFAGFTLASEQKILIQASGIAQLLNFGLSAPLNLALW